MMEIKKYFGVGMIGALGLGIGYLYSKIKHMETGRKIRLGAITGMSIVFAGYSTCNNLGPKAIEYFKDVRIQEIKIDSMKVEKGWKDQSYDDKRLEENTQKIHQLSGQVSTVKQDLEGMMKSGFESNAMEIKDSKEQIISNFGQKPAITEYRAPPSDRHAWLGDGYLIEIDKSDNTLKLYDNQGREEYSCPVILARNGGPPNGLYEVKSVQQRSGDLYPGFIRLEGVIGISGSGEYSQYDDDIMNSRNTARTGIRTYNDSFSRIISEISGSDAKVRVVE